MLATVLHSAFNHFFIAPTVTTVLILVVLPAFFVGVFHFSEARTREWLGTGFDTDAELLATITAWRAMSIPLARIDSSSRRRSRQTMSTTVAGGNRPRSSSR